MKRLMTQGEVCELLRCSFSTLSRMMNSGDFLNPVNGRGRKLVFDPDTVEAWIKARQQPLQAIMSAGVVPNPAKQKQRDKNKIRRLEMARATLDRHRITTKKEVS